MAFVEIQVSESTFALLVQSIASTAPNPFPTFDFLSGRLIRSMQVGGVPKYGPPLGTSTPPGTVMIGLDAEINSVTIGELEADPNAAGNDMTVTLWTAISVAETTLGLTVMRVDGHHGHQDLDDPVPLISQELTAPIDSMTIEGAAMLYDRDHKLVVVRLAMSAGSAASVLTSPIVDRLGGQTWAIHVASGVLTQSTRAMINAQLADNLPDDIQIEEPTTVVWEQQDGTGPWGMSLSVGLLAIDSCPALIGDDVDMSVELIARLDMSADAAAGTLRNTLHVTHDASDWDTFRCVMQNIGSGIVAFATTPAFWALSAAAGIFEVVIAPFLLPPMVGSQAGDTIADQELSGWDKQATPDEDDDATFTQTIDLPRLLGDITVAAVNAGGLLVRGTAAAILPGHHVMTHKPLEAIKGEWIEGFSCTTKRWSADYVLERARMRDRVAIGESTLAKPPVTVWITTVVLPPLQWRRKLSSGEFGAVDVYPGRSEPPEGATGRLYMHSSAGLARFDIAPVPRKPEPPSEQELLVMRMKCVKAGNAWSGPRGFDLHWLIDPPPYESMIDVMRQWLIQMDEVPTGATVEVAAVGENVARRAQITGSGHRESIEIVTSSKQTLRVTIGGNATVVGKLHQRLLLVLEAVDLDAPIATMARTGNGGIAALTAQHVALITGHGRLVARYPGRGAIGLAHDHEGLVAWGPAGAHRITGVARGALTDRPIRAAVRHDGRLVLQTVDGQVVLRGRRVEHVKQPVVFPAASKAAVNTITLAPDRVMVADGRRVLLTEPWGEKRDIVLD